MQQSNTYILIFSVIMTIIIGGVMSMTSVFLKPAQDRQVELDTKKKILGAVVDISQIEDPQQILDLYNQRVRSMVVDINGNEVTADAKGLPMVAEKINPQKNHKRSIDERYYPVFMVSSEGDSTSVEAYVFPMFGSGLWDWISGYIALEGDLNTVKGIAFDHKQETPGLGARIMEVQVQQRFVGKKIFAESGSFESITMLKGEGNQNLSAHEVDGLSGATMTSKGVNIMLDEYLQCYTEFFKKLKSDQVIALNTIEG